MNQRSKSSKTIFRKAVEWLHLWLGLASSIVVFIVCLTAAIWVFRPEIERLTLPHHQVPESRQPYLQPSHLRELADKHLSAVGIDAGLVHSIFLGKSGWSAMVSYQNAANNYVNVYLNPCNGRVLHTETEPSTTVQFMLFLRAGHRFFWLPPEIGSPFVGISCILFLITLITGLVWWYPQKWTKSTRQKSFQIKWNATWKRLNIDLHNVLGFYSVPLMIILIITGIYYSFFWFKEGYHQFLTGKRNISIIYPYEATPPTSDTTWSEQGASNTEDTVWKKIAGLAGTHEINLVLPATRAAPYTLYINPDVTRDGYYYRMYAKYFDQYTLTEIYSEEAQHVRFEQLALGEKIFRANYEIHVGSIGGLPTRILASLASLIGASLPVTGFIIWYNRKWRKQKPRKKLLL